MRWDLAADIARLMGILLVVILPAALFMGAMFHEIDHMFWRTSRFPAHRGPEPRLLSYLAMGVAIALVVEVVFAIAMYIWPNGLMGKY